MIQEPLTPLVFAVTVNWNRPADTIECLTSLTRQSYPNLKILVIDNGSTDGSPEQISSYFPQVELIVLPTNLRFAGGYNVGITTALQKHADYIFICNNDATLAPDGIERLVHQATEHTGILAPLIYYTDAPDRIWSAGGGINRWNLEIRHEWENQKDPGNFPIVLERDFVTGCGMLLTRNVLEQVGLFDESFIHYYEDLDYCYRVKQAGFSIQVVPGAKMWHKVAISSGGTGSPQERYWMARSSIRYFCKHARGVQQPVILFWRTGSAIRTTLRLLREEKKESIQAYWRGLRDGLFLHENSLPDP